MSVWQYTKENLAVVFQGNVCIEIIFREATVPLGHMWSSAFVRQFICLWTASLLLLQEWFKEKVIKKSK